MFNKKELQRSNRYVITYSQTPSSFDPLDFDGANNFNFARCLYATPLEFNQSGELSSSILSYFEYSKKEKHINFTLKSDVFFEDGTKMTVDDLIMAVKRMALARPNFPVLEKIIGIEKWRKEKYPLAVDLEGISSSADSVKISLSEDLDHPLFRFTLEVFSIIPSKCINVKTNKLLCSKPPESGNYRTKTEDLGLQDYFLEKRVSESNASLPNTLMLSYRTLDDAMDFVVKKDSSDDSNTVITSNGNFYFEHMPDKFQEKKFPIRQTPKAWHYMLKFNSSKSPFNKKEVRAALIREIRKEFRRHVPEGISYEESIFSKLLPGYISYNNVEINQQEKLLSLFKDFDEIKWIGQDQHHPIDKIILQVCGEVGIKCKKLTRGTPEASLAIAQNDYDFWFGFTGFWSLDPFGDIKMLFTPNMHTVLQDIASDDKIQKSLSRLNDSNYKNKKQEAQELDRYIHDQYIYNVIAHFPFIFLFDVNDERKIKVPQSGTLPYPWVFF